MLLLKLCIRWYAVCICPWLDLENCELFQKVIILPHFYRSTTFSGNAIFVPGYKISTIKSWLFEGSLQNVCLSYPVYERSETNIIFFLFSTAFYILSMTQRKINSFLSYCLLFFSGTSDLLTNLRWKDSIHWIKVKEQKIIKVELSNKSTAEAMKK